MLRFTLRLLLLHIVSTEVTAKVVLPSLISDNLVLQQHSKARLWGTARNSARLKISKIIG
ncbi:MAG: hypothetical protein WKF68_11405 [Daejeonella sp.]